MDIHQILTSPRSPWQNAFVERFIGSARRERLDHMIVLNEAGLRKLMTLYGSYYERARTHVSLHNDTPIPRPVTPPGDGAVVAIPEVGGLHHRYERRAASDHQHAPVSLLSCRQRLPTDVTHGRWTGRAPFACRSAWLEHHNSAPWRSNRWHGDARNPSFLKEMPPRVGANHFSVGTAVPGRLKACAIATKKHFTDRHARILLTGVHPQGYFALGIESIG
jgi:Integrase core domain